MASRKLEVDDMETDSDAADFTAGNFSALVCVNIE